MALATHVVKRSPGIYRRLTFVINGRSACLMIADAGGFTFSW
jgi:hypothetical protein